MSRMVSNFVKGVGAGMIAGATVAAVSAVAMKNKKTVMKRAGKAVKAIGNVFDDIGCMMK